MAIDPENDKNVSMCFPRSIALLFIAIILSGCAHQNRNTPNAADLAFAGAAIAVMAPPIIAYAAVDKALALGPTPRQSSPHPLTGKPAGSWTLDTWIHDIAWKDDHRLSVLFNNAAEIWDVDSAPKMVMRYRLDKGVFGRQELSPAHGSVVLVREPNFQSSWDRMDNSGVVKHTRADASCEGAAISVDGDSMVCDGKSLIGLYAIDSGQLIWSFARPIEEPTSCSPKHPCHPNIVAATSDWIAYTEARFGQDENQIAGPIELRSQTGERRTLNIPTTGNITSMQFSPDGKFLLSLASKKITDSTLYVFDIDTGNILFGLPDANWNMAAMRYNVSHDNRILCVSTKDSGLLLIDLRTRAQEIFKTGEHYHFSGCSFSPDGSRIAMAVSGSKNLISIYTLN